MMVDIEKDFFANGATIRGGLTYYFPANVAIEVIKKCRELNRRITGIDAVLLTDTTTQPVGEHSIDFTSNDYRRSHGASDAGNWEDAIRFIREREERGLYFEIGYV